MTGLTPASKQLLLAFLQQPDQEQYAGGLMAATGLERGSVQGILARFTRAGWLTSRLEDTGPAKLGRPRRRYFRLTEDGAEQARQLTRQEPAQESVAFARARRALELTAEDEQRLRRGGPERQVWEVTLTWTIEAADVAAAVGATAATAAAVPARHYELNARLRTPS